MLLQALCVCVRVQVVKNAPKLYQPVDGTYRDPLYWYRRGQAGVGTASTFSVPGLGNLLEIDEFKGQKPGLAGLS